MRGYPLIRLLFVGLALALTGIPVWKSTCPPAPAAVPVPALETSRQALFDITLTSSAPARISIVAAGKNVAASDTMASTWKLSMRMDAKKPDDLIVRGEASPDAKSLAVRIQVSSDGKKLTDTTLWGTSSLEDVVEIPAL